MVVAPAAPAWPKPAAGQPTVVLPVRHGSAEHSYLRNFPDWEQATRLTFELGLAISTQKLDRRGEGIELAALQKLVQKVTGGMPTRELADPGPSFAKQPPPDPSATQEPPEIRAAQTAGRPSPRHVSGESGEGEWFEHPQAGTPLSRRTKRAGDQSSLPTAGAAAVREQLTEDGEPVWYQSAADDDKEKPPWGIGRRTNPRSKPRQIVPRDKPFGVPTPGYDGVGLHGHYLRGVPAGPRPETAPSRPWATDPGAGSMFADVKSKRVSWAEDENQDAYDGDEHDPAYDQQRFRMGVTFPDPMEPPELVGEEPLSPEDYEEQEGLSSMGSSQLGQTGRVHIAQDGRRVWGPVTSPARQDAAQKETQRHLAEMQRQQASHEQQMSELQFVSRHTIAG